MFTTSFFANVCHVNSQVSNKVRNVILGTVTSLCLLLPTSSALAAQKPLEGVTLSAAFSVVPPFVTLSESLSEPSGIDIEILYELQRRTGFKLSNDQVDIMNFSEMVELGRSGKVDIVAGSISYSDDRAKAYDTSSPYYLSSVSLVTRANDTIKQISDLSNRTVAVQRGTNMSSFFNGVNNVRQKEVPSTFMAFFAVSRGEADAMFIDGPIAVDYVSNWKNGNLKIVGNIPNTQSALCFLFKKNSPHNVHLKKAFDEMRADGTILNIFKKYLKEL